MLSGLSSQDGHPAEPRLLAGLEELVPADVDGEAEDVGRGGHHAADVHVVELEDGGDDLALLGADDARLFAALDEDEELSLVDADRLGVAARPEEGGEGSDEALHHEPDGQEHDAQDPQRGGGGVDPAALVAKGDVLGRDLGEQHERRRDDDDGEPRQIGGDREGRARW